MGLGTALESISQPSENAEWLTGFAPQKFRTTSSCSNFAEQSLTFPSLNALGRTKVSFTYNELLCSTRQTINALLTLNVSKNEAVSVLLPQIPQAYYAVWAAETIGIANPISAGMDVEQISAILSSTKPRVLVTLGPLPGVNIWEKSVRALRNAPSVQVILVVDLKAQLSKTSQAMASLYLAVDTLLHKNADMQSVLKKCEMLDFNGFVAQQPSDRLPPGINFNSQRLDTFFELEDVQKRE